MSVKNVATMWFYYALPTLCFNARRSVTNASRQLCESVQGVRKTHPGHRKVRVGHKDYVWLPWQQQIRRFLSGFQ